MLFRNIQLNTLRNNHVQFMSGEEEAEECNRQFNSMMNDFDAWGKGRELPKFAKESFNEMWKKNKVQGKEDSNE